VPLGIAGGLWALKGVAALTSLATVFVIWRAAGRLGHSRRTAIVFYGCNPLVIVFAVAGAHNDTLFGMFLAAGALGVLAGEELRGGAALALATAVKASAGLALPFALLGARRRGRALAASAIVLALCLLAGVLAYGPHVFEMASAWLTQQHQVAGHSIPSQVSKLLGLGQLAPAVRIAFLTMFAVVLAALLWRAWKGAWWIDCYGYATLALLAATAWILPWYGLWALLPASLSANRRLRVGALIACAYLVGIRILVSTPLAAG
jgi:alpha-1,6-mannosyltransferase